MSEQAKRDGRGAPPPVDARGVANIARSGGAPTHSAEIREFRPRRTYLDACREQGVYRIENENADLKAELAAHTDEDRERARRHAEEQQARLEADAAAYRALLAQHPEHDDRARAAVVERHRAMLQAFADAGHGGPLFQMLLSMMFDTDIPASAAPDIFAAASRDHA